MKNNKKYTFTPVIVTILTTFVIFNIFGILGLNSTATELNKAKVETPSISTLSAEVVDDIEPGDKSNGEHITPTVSIKGVDVEYKNTSIDELQSFINANPDKVGTYYGSSFKGDDNQPTHFAGHDFGRFGIVKDLKKGDEITVTDESGKKYTYVVRETYLAHAVYENGEGFLESQEDVDFITRQMNTHEEMIYLQTCASEVVNGEFDIFYAVAFPK